MYNKPNSGGVDGPRRETDRTEELRQSRHAKEGGFMMVYCPIHWFPEAYYEFLGRRSVTPTAECNPDGSWTRWAASGVETLPAAWFDLEDQIASLDATGQEMAMVSSLGPHSDLDG